MLYALLCIFVGIFILRLLGGRNLLIILGVIVYATLAYFFPSVLGIVGWLFIFILVLNKIRKGELKKEVRLWIENLKKFKNTLLVSGIVIGILVLGIIGSLLMSLMR